MHEKRLTTRLIDHWRAMPRPEGQALPNIRDWRVQNIADLLPFCARLSVQDPGSNTPLCGFVDVGEQVQTAFGKDALTGRLLRSTTPVFPAARIIRRVPDILRSHEPVEDDGQFVNEQGRVVKYRACLLPFLDLQPMADTVLIGFNWRIF